MKTDAETRKIQRDTAEHLRSFSDSVIVRTVAGTVLVLLDDLEEVLSVIDEQLTIVAEIFDDPEVMEILSSDRGEWVREIRKEIRKSQRSNS
jgi:hypothetical protein